MRRSFRTLTTQKRTSKPLLPTTRPLQNAIDRARSSVTKSLLFCNGSEVTSADANFIDISSFSSGLCAPLALRYLREDAQNRQEIDRALEASGGSFRIWRS